MGQGSGKVNQKVKQLGFSSLPQGYSLNEDKIFKSQASSTSLKGISVLLNTSEIEAYLSHMQFRKAHKQFVQILHVDVRTHQEDYCKLIVYIQYLPIRLSEAYSFHFNNMIRILYHSLKGFKILFQKFGYFTIDSSLISLNEEGVAKCWVSQRYSNFVPKPSFSYHKVKNGQASMTQQLKEVFRCQVDKATVPRDFKLLGNTFESLINQLQTNFGQEFLSTKLDLNTCHQETSPKTELTTGPSSARSITGHKTSSGAPIRFNYQMKQQNNSNIRITFNNKSVEATRRTSTSVQKVDRTKINFSYQQRQNNAQIPQEKSLIHELECTKAQDNIIEISHQQ